MVLFDLCGTLFKSNTTFDFVKYCFPNQSKLIFSIPLRIINKISISLFRFDLVRYLAIYTFKGKTEQEVSRKAELFYHDFLSSRKIEEVICIFEQHKSDVCIVSATVSPVARVVAKNLGIKFFIASEMELDRGVYTGKLSKDTLGNKSKFLSDSIDKIDLVVTDNKTDMDIVHLSKKAILVSNSKNIPFWKVNKRPQDYIIEVS